LTQKIEPAALLADKGYDSDGFISPDEGGEDLFVHHSGIAGNGYKSLDEGAKVSYEATQGRKGMQADNVSAV
jgi:CspA family cold shock protein